MTDYRYILDKGSKKFRCPSCRKKRFVKYIDQKEDCYLPERYGRCDREDSCGYFLSPYDDDSLEFDNEDWRDRPQKPEKKEIKYVPYELFKKSRSNYENNSFVRYLLTLFDDSTVSDLIQKYHIGTSSKINGGCIFYQIDIKGNIRRGKIMVYGKDGHKQRFGSVHSQLGWSDYLPAWRYFGEHLITDDQPVAVVESEKTAIISSVYFPEYTWIATGTKSTLKAEYCHSLMGKDVTLFPDIGAFQEWQQKADELSYFCNINTSDLLENLADPEAQAEGYDLADYLTQFNPKDFQEKDTAVESKFGKGYPAAWDDITLTKGDPEYIEATRHAVNDASLDELEELCRRDPIVEKLINMFDGEVTTAVELTH